MCVIWCLEAEEENVDDSDGIGNLITELIMWKDVQKSTFWFGFGSLCFLSSCFTKGINFRSATVFFLLFLYLWPFSLLCIVNNSEVFFCDCCFSIFSAISQLGILFLAFSFISNSVRQRYIFTFFYDCILSYDRGNELTTCMCSETQKLTSKGVMPN